MISHLSCSNPPSVSNPPFGSANLDGRLHTCTFSIHLLARYMRRTRQVHTRSSLRYSGPLSILLVAASYVLVYAVYGNCESRFLAPNRLQQSDSKAVEPDQPEVTTCSRALTSHPPRSFSSPTDAYILLRFSVCMSRATVRAALCRLANKPAHQTPPHIAAGALLPISVAVRHNLLGLVDDLLVFRLLCDLVPTGK